MNRTALIAEIDRARAHLENLERRLATEHDPRRLETERTLLLDEVNLVLEATQILLDRVGLGDRIGVQACYEETGDIMRAYELAETMP